MIRFVRRGVLVVAIGGAMFVPGCETDLPPTPLPTPPPQVVRAVVASTSFSGFPTDIYLAIPIPLEQGGILDFTVDWTFSNTYMEVAFGRTPCTFDQLNARTCPFVVATPGTAPKPRIIVTEPVSIGTYFLYLYSKPWVKKDGTGSENVESVALQIALTVGETLPAPRSAAFAPIRLGTPVVIK